MCGAVGGMIFQYSAGESWIISIPICPCSSLRARLLHAMLILIIHLIDARGLRARSKLRRPAQPIRAQQHENPNRRGSTSISAHDHRRTARVISRGKTLPARFRRIALHRCGSCHDRHQSCPPTQKLALATSKEQFAAEYFAERREIGLINTGAAGTIIVDGKSYSMENCDGLYIGRGSQADRIRQRQRRRSGADSSS